MLEYPTYFLIFCLLAGGFYAFIAYYRSHFGEKGVFWEFPTYLMAIFRFVAVSLIAFLLLSPFLKNYYKEVEKPSVAIVTDNSKSITLNQDSTFYQDSLESLMNNLSNHLKQDYEVKTFSFGDQVKNGLGLDFSAKKTNISKPLERVYNRFYNRNLGAVILATDGIYNQGKNPLVSAKKIQAPIYTLALGDTIPPKDILVKRLRHNEIVFAGNEFPVEIGIEAEGLSGKKTAVKILKENEVVYSTDLNLGEKRFDTTIKAFLKADEPGMRRFQVKVEPLKPEISKVNNQRNFFINVLESRKNILIVGQNPHPDLKVLKNSVESNERYEATTLTIDQWQKKNENLEKYQMVFVHNLPSPANKGGRRLIKKLLENRKPAFFMVGGETGLEAFNQLKIGLAIKGADKKVDKVIPSLVKDFNQFDLPENANELFPQLPPIFAPHGEYTFNTQHDVLLKQKIGQVVSDKPLMSFLRRSDHKIAVFAGTGFWRWYLNEYRLNRNHKVFNQMISKSIQLLTVKADKKQFRLRDPAKIFNEDQKVTFEAELYNNSYEPVKGADIKFLVTDQNGKEYQYEFREIDNGYRVDAGYLPAGKYQYKATTSLGEETFVLSGRFIIKPVQQEHLNTVANHRLLYSLAKESSGQIFSPKQTQELRQTLSKQNTMKPVSHMKYELRELIHNKFLFFVIVIFLGVEWFFRKFYGSY